MSLDFGGSRSTQKEPTQIQGERTNSPQKGPGQGMDVNSGPSCSEATVLTTMLLY